MFLIKRTTDVTKKCLFSFEISKMHFLNKKVVLKSTFRNENWLSNTPPLKRISFFVPTCNLSYLQTRDERKRASGLQFRPHVLLPPPFNQWGGEEDERDEIRFFYSGPLRALARIWSKGIARTGWFTCIDTLFLNAFTAFKPRFKKIKNVESVP